MKTKMKLMLLAVTMAVILTAASANAAELTHDATVEVSDNNGVFNVSVYPGKASYSGLGGTVTGVFGDGTVLDYRFFTTERTTIDVMLSYADGGAGIVEPVPTPPDGNVDTRESWADVWTTSDPGVGFANAADYTIDTIARAQNITGTIDISLMASGTLYFIYGSYSNPNTVSLTMSGAGQPDLVAGHTEDPAAVNKGWISSFNFADAGAYDTITYTYTNTDADGSRARFMGVIVEGTLDPMNPSPADGDTVSAGDVVLSWTNMDPNTPGGDVYVDVWFGTDPNDETGTNFTRVVIATDDPEGVNTTTVTVSAPTVGETYYWAVDSYTSGSPTGDPNFGKLYRFVAADLPPVSVVIDTPDMMTWSGEGVGPLAGTVFGDDGLSGLSYLWSADPVDGVTVEFSDPGDPNPTVTITKVPYLVPFVGNGGFEDPEFADAGYGQPVGWTDGGYYLPDRTTWHVEGWGSGAVNPSADEQGYDGIAPEGENVAYTSSYAGYVGGLRHILSVTLQADTQYDLSAVAGNPSVYNGGATADYRVELVAGGVVIASTSGASPNGTTDPNWFDVSLSHTSGADDVADPNVGQTLEIRLLAVDFADDYEVHFDDVQLLIDGEAGVIVYDPSMSAVTLTLAVNDAANPTTIVEGTMTIDVYDTACLMARFGEDKAVDNPGDLDGNCITGPEDLAMMVATWLNDTGLEAAEPESN